jgi:serine/threonine protein kinase
LERLGAGGMGMVYLAQHLWLERSVAVKLLPEELLRDQDAVARFRREMRAVGRLNHPLIVRATDAGEAEGIPFLVTELVDGLDLTRLVRQCGPLRVDDACEIVRQAAEALQYAHGQGLVHRDVKPSNIMLTRDGAVKLLDFGLARGREVLTTLTCSGTFLGTLDYMAPEQAGDSRNVDIRADLYSLGCTLYFLLTGQAPFGGAAYATPAGKLRGHLENPPPAIERLRARLPLRVLGTIERLMAKRPEDRFAAPVELAQALGPCSCRANLPRLAASALAGSDPPRDASPGLLRFLLAGICRAAAELPPTIGRPKRSQPQAQRHRQEPLLSLSGVLVFSLILGFFLFTGFNCERIDPEMPGLMRPSQEKPDGISPSLEIYPSLP